MINNLLKNICLIIFALVAPITLPAGGIQKSLDQYNFLYNTKEIILLSETSLYSYPKINAEKLMVIDSGTLIKILQKWKAYEGEFWVRVKLSSHNFLDDPNKITKGWIKM